MFHWSSTRHHYDAYQLLFHIQEIDRIGMVNRLWGESLADVHPLMTYRRLKGWTQRKLNDFIYTRRQTAYTNHHGTGFSMIVSRSQSASSVSG